MTCLVGLEGRPLTDREIAILRGFAAGGTAWKVACDLEIAESTVRNHLARIRVRLAARTTTHAVAIAIRQGSLP